MTERDPERTPRLRRGHDGRYHGTHHDVPFTVWKNEYQDRHGIRRIDWFAEASNVWAGDLDGQGVARRHHPRRGAAVEVICREIDMAAVQIPEIDALLKRWAEVIREIAMAADTRDLQAHAALANLRQLLDWVDRDTRWRAVQFMQELAKLKVHVKAAPPAAQIAGEDAP